LFHADSALGIRPSECSPLHRCSARFRLNAPTYRFSCDCSHRRSEGRPRKPRFLGFVPAESPLSPAAGLARRTPDTPLGFFPSRAILRKPWPGLLPASSHTLCRVNLLTDASASQSLDRPSLGSIRSPPASRRVAQNNPLKVSAPVRSWHSSLRRSGYVFTSRCVVRRRQLTSDL
jgi:hypothetical protein